MRLRHHQPSRHAPVRDRACGGVSLLAILVILNCVFLVLISPAQEPTDDTSTPLRARFLDDQALGLVRLGDFAKAAEMRKQALDIDLKLYGEEDLRVATARSWLAELYLELDLLSAAETEARA